MIQSGLDSIKGKDAPNIVALFKSMSVFEEDQVVPLPILNVLWSSLHEDNQILSAVRIRNWVGNLLSRSILLGSIAEGLHMHDSKSRMGALCSFTAASHSC